MATLKYSAGSYVGNGVDNRDIGGFYIASFGFMLITRGSDWVIRTAAMAGDFSLPLSGAIAMTNRIKSVTPGTVFRIGTDVSVNNNGTTYNWIAFANDADFFKSGSYVGDGLASKVISLPGFTPTLVMVMETSGAGYQPVFRTSGMAGDATFIFGSTAAHSTNRIKSLDVGGFTLGSDFRVNESGKTYHYLAFGTDNTKGRVGSYTGNNADNRNITVSPAIQPVFGLIKRQASANLRLPCARWRPLSGDTSTVHTVGYLSDLIQAFQVDGFQVGTDYYVNGDDLGGAAVNTYHWAILTAELQDADPLAGFSSALPVVCGHSLMVNPVAQN